MAIDLNLGINVPGQSWNVGEDTHFKDSDTVANTLVDGTEQSVRFQNFSGPEVQHIRQAEGYFPWSDDYVDSKSGEFQGIETTDALARIANEEGYTKVWTSGNKGKYGRDLGGLEDESGEDIGARATYEGLGNANPFESDSTTYLRDSGQIGSLFRTKDNAFQREKRDLEKNARDRFGGWKATAMNESELHNMNRAYESVQSGVYNPYAQDRVDFRHKGQNVQGEAYNALFTGLEGGANNVVESFYGAASAIGDLVGSDNLYDWGKIKAIGAQDPTLGRFVNNIGDVNSAADFGRYAAGMTGQMMPYLAGLWAAGNVGAMIGGPIGAIVAVGTPALVYAGEIYNGMEGTKDEKNVGVAFTGGLFAAVVDRFALNGLVKVSDLVKGNAEKQLVAAYKAKFPKSRPGAAEKAVSRAFAVGQRDLMRQLGHVELSLNKSLVAKEMGKGFFRAGTREGITEVAQEGAIYASQVAGSNKEWNQDEFENILANAATGGFLLGGAIGGIGGAKSYGDFLELQRQHGEVNPETGKPWFTGTTETNLKEGSDAAIKAQTKSGRKAADVSKDAAKEYDEGRASDTIRGSGIKRWAAEAPSLYFRKLGDSMMTRWGTHHNPIVRHLMATLTSNFANTTDSSMSGMSHNKSKQMLYDQAANKFNIIEESLTTELGMKLERKLFVTKKGKANSDQTKASKMLRDYMRAKETNQEIPAHLKEHIDALESAAIQVNMVTNDLLDTTNSQAGKDIKGVKNYFGQAARIDPKKIDANPITFKKLTDYLGYDADQAKLFREQLLGAPEGYQPGKMQELGFRHITEPGSLKQAKAKIKDFPGIETLMMDNHFDQIRAIAKEDINYAVDINRLGEKGVKVDAMIMELKKQMGADWDPRIATWVKDSIAAGRGDYRKIKSKMGNDLQQWVLWLNALTQLDTSMLASLPELAMVFYGRGKPGSIVNDIRDGSVAVGKDMAKRFKQNKAKMMKDYDMTEETYNAAVEDFYRLGYGESHSSAAALFSSEAEKGAGFEFRDKTMQAFFKLNMLQQFTDASRIAKLGIAGQAIIGDIETLVALKGINNGMHFDAVGRLRDLNVDPEVMAETYSKFIKDVGSRIDKNDANAIFEELVNNPAHAELLQMFDNAKSSYVDNVLARPTHEDRPLWYSNPHYKLLTQYTGFLSTFTANTLPRLYGDLKKGNPQAQFQAAAAIMSMLALGFMGQGLKDEIYDRNWHERPQGLNFYQRGLQSSGLIGTGERWLDALHPVYGEAGILNFSSREGLTIGDSVKAQFGPTVGTGEKWFKYLSELSAGKDTGNQLRDLTPYGKLIESWDSVLGTDYLKE